MSIEWQVSSLEWSRQLKDLGVVQESEFYWVLSHGFNEFTLVYVLLSEESYENYFDDEEKSKNRWSKRISAFTVAELGVALPSGTVHRFINATYDMHNGKWECMWGEFKTHELTEANARSAMLCHLLENKIISLEEVNERLKNC